MEKSTTKNYTTSWQSSEMISTHSHTICTERNIAQLMISSNLKALSTNERLLMKNVVTIVITLVNGATTATTERSFSVMRRIKTRLHTTMTHRRFNALPNLNSSKSLANKLPLVKVVIDFVHSSPNRRNDLGFSQKRI